MKICWELFDGAEDRELLMGERVIGLILLTIRLARNCQVFDDEPVVLCIINDRSETAHVRSCGQVVTHSTNQRLDYLTTCGTR